MWMIYRRILRRVSHNRVWNCIGRSTFLCSYSEGGGLATPALEASATDQSALLDLERTEGSPLWESDPSDNAAAQRNSLVGERIRMWMVCAHASTYFSNELA